MAEKKTSKKKNIKTTNKTKVQRTKIVKKKNSTNEVNWKLISIIAIVLSFVLLIGIIIFLVFEKYDGKENHNQTPEIYDITGSDLTHKVLVVEDETCSNCGVDIFLDVFKQGGLSIDTKKYSKNSDKGKQVIESLDAKTLPLYLFDLSLKKSNLWESQFKQFFTLVEINDESYYYLNPEVLSQAGQKRVLVNEVELSAGTIKLGDDSKIRVIEFSDYECPYCAIAEGNTELVASFKAQNPDFEAPIPKVFEKYLDTGKVSFAFINLPFHPTSKNTHLAGLCANEQNQWRNYNKIIFENFQNGQSKDIETLISYAKDLNLDIEKFESCLKEEKYANQIEEDLKLAASLGIRGTPGFIIGNEIISGVLSYSEMERIIESQLN